ncbi:MAG: NAD-dependent epimerase/dehydratase family protein [Candidatus Binatus sp.]|uniref:NAD-dependent epimerase/dehydratase family protein n=1 Tax=Candidatus Binatus sp. TaxID=2811406 RepID=UPI00271CDEBE|nr:NAD-dependent epimerase/dehydratase family protein [Candidatus Binatus sp.]MDO8432178.1 NAD-dependent epimerase/dehydratase family protein [Candidatus Binatus sp.]
MKICVTGSAGFITGYLVEDLLKAGHAVFGIDNYSKYGEISRSYDNHPNYHFVSGDAKNLDLLKSIVGQVEVLVAAAARIGGISYFHEYAYDLLAENERITAAAFDAALWARRERGLRRIVVISSSMVFEGATVFPTPEGAQLTSPPPHSTYGFQKLATEYFARGAWEQYQLPYTIVRPFNCVGIGEGRALNAPIILSGNVKLAMSHVLPDLVLKVLEGQDPLHILGSGEQVRHYTYGGDVALGIRLALESERTINDDVNISTGKSTTVLELAELIWKKINGSKPFRYVNDPAYPYDVQVRMPDVRKASDLLGFNATTTLDDVLNEVVPWIELQWKQGRM